MQNQDAGDTENKPNDKHGHNEIDHSSKEINKEKNSRQEGIEGDALAWLEGPAFNAPIEEMPTLQWPDINSGQDIEDPNVEGQTSSPLGNETETEEPVNNLEDAMNWLEELAAGQGTPIDEMPTLISGGQYDDNGPEDFSDSQQSMEITGKTSTLPDHDSDPMAWLEQLAVDQSSPLEELPSVADRLLASEIISENDVERYSGSVQSSSGTPLSVEVDQALAYLEMQAAENGIDLNQINIDQLQMIGPIEQSIKSVDQLAEQNEEDSKYAESTKNESINAKEDEWEDLSTQIPDDPDEALKWLGALADEENLKEEGDVPEDVIPEISKLDVDQAESERKNQDFDGQAGDVQTFEDMPDDPDEAMLWMQKLANQGQDPEKDLPEQNVKTSDVKPETAPPKQSSLDAEVLTHARNALNAGEVDKATEYYQDLLESGNGGSIIIQELEKAVKKVPNSSDLFRLLGDAYMQDGQMQKALKTYRKGFDHL